MMHHLDKNFHAEKSNQVPLTHTRNDIPILAIIIYLLNIHSAAITYRIQKHLNLMNNTEVRILTKIVNISFPTLILLIMLFTDKLVAMTTDDAISTMKY